MSELTPPDGDKPPRESENQDDITSRRADLYLEVRKVDQSHRTLRVIAIGTIAYFMLCRLIDAWKESESPPWMQVLAILLPAAGSAGAVYFAACKFRGYVRVHQQGKIDVEAAVDYSRTSSGLKEDGSNPNVD